MAEALKFWFIQVRLKIAAWIVGRNTLITNVELGPDGGITVADNRRHRMHGVSMTGRAAGMSMKFNEPHKVIYGPMTL